MFPHKENIQLIKVEKFTDRIIKLAAYLKSKHVDNYIINQISRAWYEHRCKYKRRCLCTKQSRLCKQIQHCPKRSE